MHWNTSTVAPSIINGSPKVCCFTELILPFLIGQLFWQLFCPKIWSHCHHLNDICIKTFTRMCRNSQCSDWLTREPFMKGMKAQYCWPPCTNLLISATFDFAKIIYVFTKQATLIRRSTALNLPPQLIFPAINLNDS